MRVLGVAVRRLELELVRPTVTAGGTHDKRPVVLVQIFTETGMGWGECDALAEPTYTAEYADGAESRLVEDLVPRLIGESFASASAVLDRLTDVAGNPMAKAAIEMAFLDAELRRDGVSLAKRLGIVRATVPAGATIGIAPVGEVVDAVAQAAAAGFRRIKCKIEPGNDVEQLTALRSNFPELALTADANGAYRLDDQAHRAALDAIDQLGLLAIEQPLAAGALEDSARLVRQLDTAVLLDESVEDEHDLERVLGLGAADGIVIKPARVGGVLAAWRLHDRCVDAGLGLAVGGMFETGLARAVSLVVAALPGVDLPGDLGPSDRYFEPDLTVPHVMVDGMLAVPHGPGIGVAVLDDRIDRATVRLTRLGDF